MGGQDPTGVHTSLHRAELLVDGPLEPGDARRLSRSQLALLSEGLASWLTEEQPPADSPGVRVAISDRRSGELDLLAQLLLYFPRVYVPDPLVEWATFGPHIHVDWLEEMLETHRRLDGLARRGIVGFFSTMEREDSEHLFAARGLTEDASFAKAVLGSLPIEDDEWERVLRDGDDLDDQAYTEWQLTRPEIGDYKEQVVSEVMDVLPCLLGAAWADVQLIPRRPLERRLTFGLADIVAGRIAEATVSQLLLREVTFLDALSAVDAVGLREQDDTWQSWQRELESLVLDSRAKGGGDLELSAEVLDDALRQRVEAIESQRHRPSIARRVLLESSVMDLIAAATATAVTGHPVAGVPSAMKALLSPAYRATIRQTPTGADAVLLALRSKD